MNPLEAFPGGADEARKFIDAHRDARDDRKCALCNLALLGLDSLAADPEYSVSKEEEDAIVSDVLRRSRADDSLKAACERIAPWLSAALSDPSVSAEWKESCGALLAALAASNANARGGE